MRKLFLIIIIIFYSFCSFAEVITLWKGFGDALDVNEKAVPVKMSFVITSSSLQKNDNKPVLIYDNEKRGVLNLPIEKWLVLFKQAEEWYNTALKNNINDFRKHISNEKVIILNKKEGATHIAKEQTLSFYFVLYKNSTGEIVYRIQSNEISAVSFSDKDVIVYIHPLFFSQKNCREIMVSFSDENLSKLREEILSKPSSD